MPRKILGLVLFILATCATFPAEEPKTELKSMRCDRKFTYRKNTPCNICIYDDWEPKCPRGWTRSRKPEQCRYTVKLGENTMSTLGCTFTCMTHDEFRQCCPGHWGAECYECPGGPENICNQHGTCLDGNENNGTCICNANYGGIACQHCKDENHFGPDCQSVCECQHGICNHGPSGDGKCTCYAGYSGPKCDQEVPNCGGVICEANSLCVLKNGKAECECIPGYRKIGTYCLAQDPCNPSPCSQYAVCKIVEGTKYQCICAEGYQGNGKVCQVLQPCLVNNGGCPMNTSRCLMVRGKPLCQCKSGMAIREGSNDCTHTSECLPSACDQNVQRCEVTPDGFVNCICREGEIEIRHTCYKTILAEIFQTNRRGKTFNKLSDSVKLFAMGCSLTLENYGPFTVFVPTGQIVPPFNFSVSYAQEFCRKHIVVGMHFLKDMLDAEIIWTLSGHKMVVDRQQPVELAAESD